MTDPYRPDPAGPLDPKLDPDRYDPSRHGPERADVGQPTPAGPPIPLGRTGGARPTLPELLGEGSFQDKPNPYNWILGLVGVAAFLALVAVVVSHLGR